ncbi:MAG: SDR family NAD(P)-dependent oxidoreductase [Homoserinimonas sp.]
MTSIALITGATAGIGAEFARQLAARHCSLVLVARDRDRLEAAAATLSKDFGVVVQVIPADLGTKDGLAAVEARLAETVHPVDLLVNNAGFGLITTFHESPIEDEMRHLDLLVAVPMRLSHTALGQMVPRHHGTIINVASVAGYTPRGTYGAAKAWVLSFSRWANIHYRRHGITVTAVAPGFVHTEFHQRMKARTDNIPKALWLTPDRVVADALRAAAKGRAVTVPALRYKVIVALSRILPPRLVAAGALRGR